MMQTEAPTSGNAGRQRHPLQVMMQAEAPTSGNDAGREAPMSGNAGRGTNIKYVMQADRGTHVRL
jgi:hypothetical protein